MRQPCEVFAQTQSLTATIFNRGAPGASRLSTHLAAFGHGVPRSNSSRPTAIEPIHHRRDVPQCRADIRLMVVEPHSMPQSRASAASPSSAVPAAAICARTSGESVYRRYPVLKSGRRFAPRPRVAAWPAENRPM